jgi:hypothetical protein
MKKIIQLTESDLTNIVKRVIKENAAKDSLIDMIKDEGWQTVAEMVSGIRNLKNLTGIETPMDFLNIFTDLDVVQSEEEPDWELYRYEKGKIMMIYDRRIDFVFINGLNIWSFLKEGFHFNNPEIQEIMKEWLSEVYNLRGVTPSAGNAVLQKQLFEVYNLN